MASSDHHYKFNVAMSCTGCSGAVERVLKKMPGISSFDVSLENQTADVYTHDGEEGVSYEQVLEKIKKTGKAVTKGERDGVVAAI
ncbi:MAG: hypothetical protein Q9190_002976 [Brigantiaea leucoxantha]